ncbi:MAG: hypothetical protein L6Q59_09180 [Ignavibacteriaceae bacterium]|nr:hypothetical protein [Ignavibacteriaceae bacterium]
MLRVLSFFFLLFPAFLSAKNNFFIAEVDSSAKEFIRKLFYAGVEDEKKAQELFNLLTNKYKAEVKAQDPFIYGYLGASETLLAKHDGNPFKKVDYLTDGLEKLAYAIGKKPRSLELRFVRYSIIHYLPFFFNYSTERDADVEMIYTLLLQKDYSELDRSVQKGIVEFVIETDRLSKDKNENLRRLLVNLAKI